jgi:hypothetical protein
VAWYEISVKSSERQHGLDRGYISLMHCGRTAQLAFGFGGFLGEDVALERLAPLDGSATTNLKTLGSAFLGFHLRHDVTLLFMKVGDCQIKLAMLA